MGEWMQDLRDGFRRVVRTPLFTLTAVAIVALGIGANTAVFTVVNAFLFRAAPYSEPDRVVDVYQDSDDGEPNSTSFPAYLDMTDFTDVFSSVGATLSRGVSWEAPDGARPVQAEFVTSSFMDVVGLQPAMGRWFDESHDRPGTGNFAVLGYPSWVNDFGEDPAVLGRTVRLNGQPVTVIGVGPAEYVGHQAPLATDFFLSLSTLELGGGPYMVTNLERRTDHWYQVQARLAPEVTVMQAQSAMDGLAQRLATEYPELNRGRDITVFGPGEVRLHPSEDGALLPVAAVLMGIVGLILVLACSNLANLLLVRGVGRRPEVALRRALGAGRWRVARVFLIESLLLS